MVRLLAFQMHMLTHSRDTHDDVHHLVHVQVRICPRSPYERFGKQVCGSVADHALSRRAFCCLSNFVHSLANVVSKGSSDGVKSTKLTSNSAAL